MKPDYSLLQYAKITAIAAFVLLFFDVMLRKPVNVDEFLKEISIKEVKKYTAGIPAGKGINEYSLILNKKHIFNFPGREKISEGSSDQEKDALANFSFNGIIILDKKYAAIFSKKDKKQYLIPEGKSIEGIKIEKIKQSSIVIKVDDEEKEINF